MMLPENFNVHKTLFEKDFHEIGFPFLIVMLNNYFLSYKTYIKLSVHQLNKNSLLDRV